MPLVAIHPPTQSRIESLDFSSGLDIRSKYPAKELRCQFCGGEVYPRDRQEFVLHFAHKGGCSTKLGYHPESREHLQGKAYLAQLLKNSLSGYSSAPVFLEYPLPEAGQHGRIADVAVVFPSGYVLAYECQLANICVEEISQRTTDYAKAGAEVVWWIGGRANTPSIRDWCIQEFRVFYQLHELTEIPFVTRENEFTRQQIKDQTYENGSHIIGRAIRHTFFAWKRLSKEQIHRGLSILPNSKGTQSVSGYLGSLNNKAIKKFQNYWVLTNPEELATFWHRCFVPLSPQGAETIKNRAVELASVKGGAL